jgi:Polysaccharide pyruvyl transferase
VKVAACAHNGVVVGSLKASTENLGDYIQILACLRLLEAMRLRPGIYLDRDTELANAPALEACAGRVVLPLNGWFKRTVGPDPQWPPHEKIIPVFLGFHVRPHQCPALLEARSIDYLKAHGPVGCRDVFTMHTLAAKGVTTYFSNCLSLTFAARAPGQRGDLVVVASRDREILDILPPRYRTDHVYVNHYTTSDSFEGYLAQARELLAFYQARARLVITTFLHCALPCIAMGIPVVVFFPKPHDEFQRRSDEQRFSGLTQFARVHRFEDVGAVDWNPAPLDVEALRETIARDFRVRVGAALASNG